MHLPVLCILAYCCLDLALANRYHEKTRFDRALINEAENYNKSYILQYKNPSIFADKNMRYKAYKLEDDGVCYLEKMKPRSKPLLANIFLSEQEVANLGGKLIKEFCKGMKMILLHVYARDDIFYLNEIPDDSEEMIQMGMLEDTLRPWKIHSKRRKLKNFQDDIDNDNLSKIYSRRKRKALPFKGRFRGQTQSQYLNVGQDKETEGKAEAEATQQSSRAFVSGSNGMGQAQSMSSGSDECEGCSEYNKVGNIPASIQGILGSQQGHPTGNTAGTYPTGILSGPITTGIRSGIANYPSGTQTGIIPAKPGTSQISTGTYPLNFLPRTPITGIGEGIQNEKLQPGKSNTQIVPGKNVPGLQILGKNIYPEATPGAQGISVYPPEISAGNTRVPVGPYSGTIPETQMIGGKPGPQLPGVVNSAQGTQTVGDRQYISGTQPRGTQIPGTIYHPGTQIMGGRIPGQIQTGPTYPSDTKVVGDRTPVIQMPVGNTYPQGTQIVGFPAQSNQSPGRNAYSPSNQIGISPGPASQIPSVGVYRPNTQMVNGRIPSSQISSEITHPSGVQAAESLIPTAQMPSQNRFVPRTQIPGDRSIDIQAPRGNLYSPSPQIMDRRAPGTQTLGGSNYSPNTQVMEDCVPISQISGANVYPPGTQIIGNTASRTQIPDKVTYSPSTHIVGSGSQGVIPGGNVYSPDSQIITDSIPGTQALQTSLYLPRTAGVSNSGSQILDGIVNSPNKQFKLDSITGTQIPSEITYPSGSQVVAGNNLGNKIPTQITYLPGIQSAGGDQVSRVNVYPPNTQTADFDNSRIQNLKGPLYIPNSQITGHDSPGNQISGGNVYLPNLQVPQDTASRTRMQNQLNYPPSTQFVRGSTPGTQIPGSIVYPVGPQFVRGKVSDTPISGGIVYPPGTQVLQGSNSDTRMPGQIAYPQIAGGSSSGSQISGGEPFSPSSQIVPDNNRGGQSTQIYSPGRQVTGGSISGPQMPNGVPYPEEGSMYPPGTSMVGGISTNPEQGGNVYPAGSQIPNGIYGGNKFVSPSGMQTPREIYIPAGIPNSPNFGGQIYPGVVSDGSSITTGESLKPIMRGDIPGTVIYPGIQPSGPSQSGTYESAGEYSPNLTGQSNYPGENTNTGSLGQYPAVNGAQQYLGSGNVLVPDPRNPATGSNVNVPDISTGVVGTGGQAAVINQHNANNAVIGTDDGSDSQAMSSVKQNESGTLASASAEGKHGHGIAKSQVSGIYNGNGSFSAQAGTSDDTKSAQTQVSGGKDGAKSSAQSSGGIGKSQTQVQLDSESGATSTNAQSNGWNHGTNSQVQASAKGGMADAQANGEGQTSSQAQIGFQPYINRNEKFEKLEKPFRGGGTASAQSGTFRGQSQSQLQGSFHYGISYTGAAQAGSGSGSAALRKPFNFTNADPNLFKSFKLEGSEKTETTIEDTSKEQLETSGTSSRQTVIAITPRNKHLEKKIRPEQPKPHSYEFGNTDDEYEEYEDEDYGEPEFVQPVSLSDRTKQGMRLLTNGEYNVKVKHEEITEGTDALELPGSVGSSDKRKMASIVGKKNTLENNTIQNKTMVTSKPSSDTKSLHSARIGGIFYGGLQNSKIQEESSSPKTNFVSVSNSVAGKIDEKNLTKKYEHRYYTKSSTCGYFTFSCNVVYGSNGRRKICKPKMPTYSNGTPKC